MSKRASGKTIKVTIEQYKLLTQLKRSPYEPMHSVLQRIIECYKRCREYCEQREKADFDVA